MQSKVIKYFVPYIKDKFVDHQDIIKETVDIFKHLCKKNSKDSSKVKRITEGMLYPIVSIYEALLKNRISAEEALAFIDEFNTKRCIKEGKLIGLSVNGFGKYKHYPKKFKKEMDAEFNENSGFRAVFDISTDERCKLRMTKCLFCARCKEYGVTSLLKVFCHGIDAKYKNIHPNLGYTREECFGEAGEYCIFDMYVKEEE